MALLKGMYKYMLLRKNLNGIQGRWTDLLMFKILSENRNLI